MQQMAQTMQAAPDGMKDVVRALSSKVDTLVGDVGWKGDAADSFRKAWTANSIQAGALSDTVGTVGKVVGDLAGKLQQIDNALYNAAHDAQKKGVLIGPQGEPQLIATPTDSTGPRVAAVLQAQADYATTYDSAMQLAKGYRLNAADKLSGIYDQISFDPGRQNTSDQWVTIGDYLRGLYTMPGEKNDMARGKLPTEIADAREQMKQARKDLKTARNAYRVKGMKLPIDNDARLAHGQVVNELKGLETELASAEAGTGELPLTKTLNVKLSNIAKEIPQLASVAEALPKGLEFLKEIPVIDVVASGVAAELQAQDDINKGWSPEHARAADYRAVGIGLAVGTDVSVIAAAAGAPATAAVLVGGALVVGVGDFAYQGFHEHWSEDIDQHGVFGGVLTGIGHMGENTGKDFAGMGKGIVNGAKSLWRGVFG
ncbi:MAG TPA: WXG100 family type VII secretion target [Pseudonocardiaceae bacterium]|nr:WXG100 family type VII secretion target [Pseudonocardiaceae bacterium]